MAIVWTALTGVERTNAASKLTIRRMDGMNILGCWNYGDRAATAIPSLEFRLPRNEAHAEPGAAGLGRVRERPL